MSNEDLRKRLIIPVEIQHREMLAKLYLGAVAVSKGFSVVVGDQKEIARRTSELKPGIYLDKSVAKTKRLFFEKLRKLGHTPVALCEEGLVYRNKDRYLNERIDPKTFSQANIFFCWGETQKNDISENVIEKDKLLITGNPRFDLLRDEFRQIWKKESDLLFKKYGKFILINTNFSRYNRLPGTADVIELLQRRGTLDPVHGPAYYEGLVQHLATIMEAFLEVIPKIAQRFPEHAIVLRPHPGENVEPYVQLAKNYINIKINNNGSVVPWLLAADVVIHNSCTTGIEAWVLDRPVISYMPISNVLYDSKLPNELSYKCVAEDELLSRINKIIKDNSDAKRDTNTLNIAEQYIGGLNGAMAADCLIESLPKLQIQAGTLSVFKERVMAFIKRHLKKVPGLRISKGLSQLSHQKFPGMDQDEAAKFIKLIGECRPDLRQVEIGKMEGWNNVFYMMGRKE